MTDNPYISLIQGLNSGESPNTTTASSPTDHTDELSLWTNAEFTFDMPPGLGIFETDSGFNSTASTSFPFTQSNPIPALQSQPAQQQPIQFLSTPLQTVEPRSISLLERTRQRNPLTENSTQQEQQQQEQQQQEQQQQEQQQQEQHQAAVLNSFLLAAYSQAQQAQVPQLQQLQQLPSSQQPISPIHTTTPTTPAAAKLLRQKYNKPATIAQKSSVETISTNSQPQSLTQIQQNPTKKNDDDVDDDDVELNHDSEVENDDNEADQRQSSSKLSPKEDKRRRNTAASARFRQKKKLREQALEQTAREQTSRAEHLEARVKELEMEVRWLRGLIVEKDTRLHESNKRLRLDQSEKSE
ncbi:hypothetical protein BGZ76_007574 [Entomortierella beljakovae]|nr:hypothetical protein BGZ76_007574 [Entomortierella beljakovae]